MDRTPTSYSSPSVGKQMSASLKERLKKLGRYHGSPATPTGSFRKVTPHGSVEVCESPRSSRINHQDNSRLSDISDEKLETSTSYSSTRIGSMQLPSKRICLDRSSNAAETEKICTVPTIQSVRDKSFATQNNKQEHKEKISEKLLNGDTEDFTNEQLQETLKELTEHLKYKEETLRKLKLVKTYRQKNDGRPLDELIKKWRSVCQEALQELVDNSPDPKPDMEQLLLHLMIDPKTVHYHIEDESFY